MSIDYRLTLAELVTQTYRLLNDPNREMYDIAVVKEALNDAQLEYCLRTRMIVETINDLQLKAYNWAYDLRQIADNQSLKPFIYPIRVVYHATSTSDITLWPKTGLGMDRGRHRRNNEGYPIFWGMDMTDQYHIFCWPMRTNNGESGGPVGNIDVQYCAMPTYMTADDSYPDTIPALFHQALPYGAAERILEEGEEGELRKSVDMGADFSRWIGKYGHDYHKGHTPYAGARPL